MTQHPTRIGLFGIGLDAYWPQFPGLKPRLEGYLGKSRNAWQDPEWRS
jgi:L-arabinose isomerase